jgi:uncharacterized membrane protein YkoI
MMKGGNMNNTIKKLILPGAVAIAAFIGVAGGSLLSSIGVSAATNTSTSTNSSTAIPANESKGGHTANGITENVLTGTAATKAKAAAEAAVPGATVLRVENDAEGAVYEAHMQKSDGTHVTVKMDANFKVTGTETGGLGNHVGRPNDSDDQSSSSSSSGGTNAN